MSNRAVTFRLPPFALAELDKLARAGRKPRTQVVIDAVMAVVDLLQMSEDDSTLTPSQVAANLRRRYRENGTNE